MLSECPTDFPIFETHDDDNQHGDLCRNDKFHGFNFGYTCPKVCQPTENSTAPFCQVSTTNNEPCRVNKGTCFNMAIVYGFILSFQKFKEINVSPCNLVLLSEFYNILSRR